MPPLTGRMQLLTSNWSSSESSSSRTLTCSNSWDCEIIESMSASVMCSLNSSLNVWREREGEGEGGREKEGRKEGEKGREREKIKRKEKEREITLYIRNLNKISLQSTCNQ